MLDYGHDLGFGYFLVPDGAAEPSRSRQHDDHLVEHIHQ
jgi:hypothetical protein